MTSSNVKNRFIENWLYYGWAFFPCAGFVLPNVTQWKNYFYLFVLLPWLITLVLSVIGKSKINSDVDGASPSHWKNSILMSSSLLLLYLALTTLWSGNGQEYLLFYIKQFVYIGAYLCAGLIVVNHKQFDVNNVLRYTCYGAGICLAISTFMYFTQEPPHGLTKLGLPNRFWGYGMVENSLTMAQHFGGICLICVYLLFNSGQTDSVCGAPHGTTRGFLIILGVASFVAVVATMSRGATVFLLIALAIMLFSYAKNNRFVRFGGIAFITVCMLSLLAIIFIEPVRDSIFSAERDLFSVDRRMDIWSLVIDQIKENLLWGIGARKHLDLDVGYLVFHHSHSSVLETLMYGGLVALLLWAVQLFFIAKKLIKHPLFLAWFVFCLLCLLINGHYLLSRPGWQWMIYWIPVGLLLVSSKRSSQQ